MRNIFGATLGAALRTKLCTLVVLFALPLQADELPADKLASMLQGQERFSARFEQYSIGDQGIKRETSTGFFAVERPDRFIWETETPFPQQIISDGEYIWVYDPDLEQATRKSVEEGEGTAPALILNGRVDELNEQFQIMLIQSYENTQIFELVPRSEQNNLFSSVRLLFRDGILAELAMDDSLGQSSTIVLDDVQVNPELSPDLFVFVPPDGVDVMMDSGF